MLTLRVSRFRTLFMGKGDYTMSAFLDIEGASNNVTTSAIENSAVYHPVVG